MLSPTLRLECRLETETLDLARESLYRFLAAALSDPRSRAFSAVLNVDNQVMAAAGAELLREEAQNDPVPLGFGERPLGDLDLRDALAEIRRPLDDLLTQYDRAFGLTFARECPPYETEYCPNPESFFRSQQMADVAGFYFAYGLKTSREMPQRPDHIALELEFMAFLLAKRRLALDENTPQGVAFAAVCGDTARTFFCEHLAWWVPSFATGLQRKAQSGPYASLGKVLAAFMPTERSRCDAKAPHTPIRPQGTNGADDNTGCAGCTASA